MMDQLFGLALFIGIPIAIALVENHLIKQRLEREDQQRKSDGLPPFVAWVEYHIRGDENQRPYFVCYFDADYKVVGRRGPAYDTKDLAVRAAKELESNPEFRLAIQR